MTDFFIENVKETLEAINKLLEKKIREVNVKKIRICNNIKSSDRSKINFIWRGLQFLENRHILERNGIAKPVMYKILIEKRVDINNFISKLILEK